MIKKLEYNCSMEELWRKQCEIIDWINKEDAFWKEEINKSPESTPLSVSRDICKSCKHMKYYHEMCRVDNCRCLGEVASIVETFAIPEGIHSRVMEPVNQGRPITNSPKMEGATPSPDTNSQEEPKLSSSQKVSSEPDIHSQVNGETKDGWK